MTFFKAAILGRMNHAISQTYLVVSFNKAYAVIDSAVLKATVGCEDISRSHESAALTQEINMNIPTNLKPALTASVFMLAASQMTLVQAENPGYNQAVQPPAGQPYAYGSTDNLTPGYTQPYYQGGYQGNNQGRNYGGGNSMPWNGGRGGNGPSFSGPWDSGSGNSMPWDSGRGGNGPSFSGPWDSGSGSSMPWDSGRGGNRMPWNSGRGGNGPSFSGPWDSGSGNSMPWNNGRGNGMSW
jgi:hypothetical protein